MTGGVTGGEGGRVGGPQPAGRGSLPWQAAGSSAAQWGSLGHRVVQFMHLPVCLLSCRPDLRAGLPFKLCASKFILCVSCAGAPPSPGAMHSVLGGTPRRGAWEFLPW